MNKPSTHAIRPTKAFHFDRRAYSIALEIAVIGAAILICALFLGGGPRTNALKLAMGATDPLVARGFYRGETDGNGRGFRWTDGDSSLVLSVQGPGAHMLRLTIAASHPTQLSITIDDRPALTTTHIGPARSYMLLVPGAWPQQANSVVRIRSDTFQPQEHGGQPRTLGVVVYDAAWYGLGEPIWLVPLQIGIIALAVGLFALILAAAGAPLWMRLLLVAMFVAILLAMRHGDTRFLYRWNALLMTVALCSILSVLLVVLGRPREPYTVAPVRSWLAVHGAAFASYVVITILMLSQLLAVLSTHISGARGDNFEYVWKLQWFSDALIRQHISPVYTPQIYYPAGAELTISEMTPAQTLLGVPLTWLAGPVISYNTLTILSFALTACFTYLLAHRLGASRGAAWVAGLIFGFCLERFYHVVEGHFGMMGSHWLALALYGWEGVLTRRRAWDALVAGLGFALVFWTSWHYGVTFPLLIAAYTLVRLGWRGILGLLRDWRLVASMAAIVIPLILPLAEPYIEAQVRGETFRHPYAMVLSNSAVPLDYLRPNPYHPLWGAWAQESYGRQGAEFYVALGYTATLLALAGLWLKRRYRVTWGLATVLLISMILSFGPELQLSDGITLALPAKWFYEHALLLGDIRTWSRLAMYVALCGALLASMALSSVPGRWRAALCGAAAVLVLVESASAFTLSSTEPRPVDMWLRQQPDAGAVAQIPKGAGGMNQYYSLFTNKPTNQGNGKYTPALYNEERETLYDFPAESAIRLAQRWGTKYFVVIDAVLDQDNPGWRLQIANQPLITEVYHSGGYTVYRVSYPPQKDVGLSLAQPL